MQNEGKRRRKNSILTVLDKAEFIMLRDLEMSLGKGMVFCFQTLVANALHIHAMLKLLSRALNQLDFKTLLLTVPGFGFLKDDYLI